MSQSFGSRGPGPFWRHPAVLVLAFAAIIVIACVVGAEDGPAPLRNEGGGAPKWGGGAGEPANSGGKNSTESRSWAEDRVKEARRRGDPARLARLLGRLVQDESLDPQLREGFERELNALSEKRFFNPAFAGPGFSWVDVRPGDSYWKVASRLRKAGHKVSSSLLHAVNGIEPKRLRAGDRLRYPDIPLQLLVDKSSFRLYLKQGEEVVKSYAVAIGSEDRTPEGEFTIAGKVREPDWTDPQTRKHYRYGEPGHRIGSRWMRFMDKKRSTPFGIHGTDDPASIGHAASLGCIRMRKADVEELFELVPEGTRIIVRP